MSLQHGNIFEANYDQPFTWNPKVPHEMKKCCPSLTTILPKFHRLFRQCLDIGWPKIHPNFGGGLSTTGTTIQDKHLPPHKTSEASCKGFARGAQWF